MPQQCHPEEMTVMMRAKRVWSSKNRCQDCNWNQRDRGSQRWLGELVWAEADLVVQESATGTAIAQQPKTDTQLSQGKGGTAFS